MSWSVLGGVALCISHATGLIVSAFVFGLRGSVGPVPLQLFAESGEGVNAFFLNYEAGNRGPLGEGQYLPAVCQPAQ